VKIKTLINQRLDESYTNLEEIDNPFIRLDKGTQVTPKIADYFTEPLSKRQLPEIKIPSISIVQKSVRGRQMEPSQIKKSFGLNKTFDAQDNSEIRREMQKEELRKFLLKQMEEKRGIFVINSIFKRTARKRKAKKVSRKS